MKKSLLMHHNSYIMIFSIAGLLFGLVLSQSIYPVALYSILFALGLVSVLSLFLFATGITDRLFVMMLMVFSFVVKVFFIYIFEYLMIEFKGIPFLSYKDDYVYDLTSSAILDAWRYRGFGFYDDLKFGTGFYSGYPNVSAFAKVVMGDNHLAPRFLNAIVSTATVPFFYYTVKYITDNGILNKTAATLFAFSPIFITYSSLQLKETVLIFFVATSLFGVGHFFSKGISVKSALLVAVSMCALIFFRAAILLPFIIALLVAFLASKKGADAAGFNKSVGLLWVVLLVVCFYVAWEVLYTTGLVDLTGGEYFDSRFSQRGAESSYQGGNDLSKLGVIAILLGPLLAALSLFLPAPVYMQLDSDADVLPYHYFALIGYYAILPMVCISLLYVMKDYRARRVGFFLVLFMLLYKLGQAGSKSILDSRQSLPAIYVGYLLLAYFDLRNNDVAKLWRRYRIVVLVMLLLVMFSVTFLRYFVRL